MEMNVYALEIDARARLDAARARAAQRRLARDRRSSAPASRLRVRMGAALIRIGAWLQGCADPARALAPIPPALTTGEWRRPSP